MELSSGGKRVAFFGGSFDPPHLGHLAVARAARDALKLGTVLFAPVGAQPLKPHGSTAGFEDRVAMTRLAIAAEPTFTLSLADAPKPSNAPNYTLETLQSIRADLPPGSELFCLMGADAFMGLRKWHRAEEIPFAAPLIVASRPGQQLDGLRAALPAGLTMDASPSAAQPEAGAASTALYVGLLRNSKGETAPFYVLPSLHIDISASQVRKLIRGLGNPAAGALKEGVQLLPQAVLDYIRAHGLYR